MSVNLHPGYTFHVIFIYSALLIILPTNRAPEQRTEQTGISHQQWRLSLTTMSKVTIKTKTMSQKAKGAYT